MDTKTLDLLTTLKRLVAADDACQLAFSSGKPGVYKAELDHFASVKETAKALIQSMEADI
jgi:hypothetical protein